MTNLVLAGCGKMGGALLAGWLDRGLDPTAVWAVEPNAEAVAWAKARGVGVVASPDEIPQTFSPDVVMLAVKPQMMDAVVPAYMGFAQGSSVFLSIAAGKTIGYFESLLGTGAPIVRSMPNTPAAVRRGMTVACANALVSAPAKTLCGELLEAVGEVAWIDDEALMDPVTAVSGSGPAYIFLLAECLAQAGIDAGLPADLAARLARATVAGAGELLHQADETPATLRQNVTSPGGTTAEALAVLMGEDGWQPVLTKAVAAACKRSRELAG
ncbi:MAG: pyrroline-5-carboxylate reductase [Rhodospirillales bacterium]|jgi:pyrroline-5-carboxylate reductase|nr:pyrroline-5-carboxylate reductase [Rhodospirillales bacterium]